MSHANEEGYVSAPIWHLGEIYTKQVQAVIDGTWEATSYWGGMNEGVIDISDFGKAVSEETKANGEAAREQIISGELEGFAGEILNQAGEVAVAEGEMLSDDEMLSMMWFVDNVIGTIPNN